MKRRDFLGLAAKTSIALCLNGLGCRCVLAAESFEREALFYTPASIPGGPVLCGLCPHGCALPEGATGLCGTRVSRGGKIFTIVYGRVVASNCDPIEKKPLFHFLPGTTSYSIATAGCNLRCSFCQNWSISQVPPASLPCEFTSAESVASRAAALGAKSIAFTYTEPIIFSEYAIDVSAAAAERGIPSIAVTAGYMNPKPLDRLLKSLAAIKVDLKAFDEGFYRKICNASIETVKGTIKRIAESGRWLEIVCLIIPSLNDDPARLKECARWLVAEVGRDTPLHFTRFRPTYKLSNLPPTPLATLIKARDIAMAEGMRYVYVGNVPGSEAADTRCHACQAKLIERYGFQMLKNRVSTKAGKEPAKDGSGLCPSCGAAIPGVFSL